MGPFSLFVLTIANCTNHGYHTAKHTVSSVKFEQISFFTPVPEKQVLIDKLVINLSYQRCPYEM